jgi:hypothetical protein
MRLRAVCSSSVNMLGDEGEKRNRRRILGFLSMRTVCRVLAIPGTCALG